MTKVQSIVFKLFILWFGLTTIFIAYLMFANFKNISFREQYFWMNIPIIYLVFMLPTLFYSITKDSFSRRIMPVMFTYFTSLFYAIISIVLIILVLKTSMYIRVAILIQLVLLFIFVLESYIAFFTGSHIANVASKEQQLLSRIKEIKIKAKTLQYKCSNLEKLDKQSECVAIIENLIFLSPVDNTQAFSLEEKIIVELDNLSNLLSKNYNKEELQTIMTNISSLYNKRKLMMN